MSDGWRHKALTLYGAARCGKTEMLRSICVAKGWPYYFVNSIDQLRGVCIKPGYAIVFDESHLSKESPEWFKVFAGVKHGQAIGVRYENVFIPAAVPRLVSTNANSPDEFLPKPRNENDRVAMLERCVFVPVRCPLFLQSVKSPRDPVVPVSAPDLPPAEPAQPSQSSGAHGVNEYVLNTLRELVEMRRAGFLNETEFTAAKKQILGLRNRSFRHYCRVQFRLLLPFLQRRFRLEPVGAQKNSFT